MQFASLIAPEVSLFQKHVIAIIGGGGKSTLMHRLGKELEFLGFRIVITSTTKFQVSSSIDVVLQEDSSDYLSEANRVLDESGIVAVAREAYSDKNRLLGVTRQTIVEMRQVADVVLIEADGSRQRPLKTHKEYEPVIPPETTSVVIVCGAEAIGKPLDDKTVHRAELFSKKWDIALGTQLTPTIAARELLSPYSYMKNIPIHASIALYVNKADQNPVGAKLLAENLAQRCNHPVFHGSLKKNQLQRTMLTSTRS